MRALSKIKATPASQDNSSTYVSRSVKHVCLTISQARMSHDQSSTYVSRSVEHVCLTAPFGSFLVAPCSSPLPGDPFDAAVLVTVGEELLSAPREGDGMGSAFRGGEWSLAGLPLETLCRGGLPGAAPALSAGAAAVAAPASLPRTLGAPLFEDSHPEDDEDSGMLSVSDLAFESLSPPFFG
jgi:hypothetical protein